MNATTRIVLTREAEANGPWAARLRAAGHTVLELPLLRYDPLPLPAGVDPGAHDWVLFTSPQGVRAFAAAELDKGKARVAALGAGTASALAEVGLQDDLGLDTRDGAEFAREFRAQVKAPARVLLPGPRKRLAEPGATLAAAGFSVTALPLYTTERVTAGELPAMPFVAGDIVFFCSPTAVAAFAAVWHVRPGSVTIGETTAIAARGAGFKANVAKAPTLDAMVRAAGFDPLPDPTDED